MQNFYLYTLLIFYCVVYLLVHNRKRKQNLLNIFGDLSKSDHVLLVTAHPDDECMFFSPTILHLRENNVPASVLCLSTGDFRGNGKTRVKELTKSCNILGVSSQNVFCLDKFEDHPKNIWSKADVADVISKYVNLIKATVVLTFDEKGVSGHVNHKSVYYGAKYFQKIKDGKIRIFTLETVNIFRKYSQLFDIISHVSGLMTQQYIVANASGYFKAYNAMTQHKSQLVWFRRIYILFSRYMFVNSWVEVT